MPADRGRRAREGAVCGWVILEGCKPVPVLKRAWGSGSVDANGKSVPRGFKLCPRSGGKERGGLRGQRCSQGRLSVTELGAPFCVTGHDLEASNGTTGRCGGGAEAVVGRWPSRMLRGLRAGTGWHR